MHPIERLRFVARSRGVPADVLVAETATALGAFRRDPAGLVAACRRVVERQVTCAPLWWLCARMLYAADPAGEGHAAVAELEADPTARHLAAALPDSASVVLVGWPEQCGPALRRRGDLEVLVADVDGSATDLVDQLDGIDVDATEVPLRNLAAAVRDADVVLIDALAAGPSEALVPAGAHGAASLAAGFDVPVWLVAGVGRLLPAAMLDALISRWSASAEPFAAFEEILPTTSIDRLVGAGGVAPLAEALTWTDCPVAPELFVSSG